MGRGTDSTGNGARVRVAAGRERQPSAAILDSQSVKTTSVGGVRGYDGAKKLSGRKRHGLVDVLGLVRTAKVQSAAIQDRAAVPLVLTGVDQQFPRLAQLGVDQGSPGSGKDWMERELGWRVEVVKHPPVPRGAGVPHGDRPRLATVWLTGERLPRTKREFRGVRPRRWVGEHTFGWFGQS